MNDPTAGLLAQLAGVHRARLAELAALERGLVEVDTASDQDDLLDEALGFPPAPGPGTEVDAGSTRPAGWLPPSLEALFAAHRPVGPRELFAAWVERATERRLAAGEVADVNAAAFASGCPRPDGPYRRREVPVILDALEGQARTRRGRFRRGTDPGQAPAIVADPEGRVDNLAAVLRDFTALAADHRRATVVAAVEARHAQGESYARLARCYAISLRTLTDWRRHQAKITPEIAHDFPDSDPKMVG